MAPTTLHIFSHACNGIFLAHSYTYTYTYTAAAQLPTTLTSDPTHQPYKFQSTLTIVNNGLDDLKSWQVFVGFQHNEYVVAASNAVLADGTSLPAGARNDTVFAGYPSTDLKTAFETAGDMTQMSAQIDLGGTQFGVGLNGTPLPSNLSLVNDGFVCPTHTLQDPNALIS